MQLFNVYYYVPESHLESTKQAIFAAGAGEIGNYSCCAFESKGQGQFRPKPGSKAFIGEIGTLETVIEYKVETVCSEDKLKKVLDALKSSHPYETPAYGIIKLENF